MTTRTLITKINNLKDNARGFGCISKEPFEDTKGQTIQWPRENRPKDKQ
jgi:hypothetical protein